MRVFGSSRALAVGPGGGRVADDGRRDRHACGRRQPGYCAAALVLPLLSGLILLVLGVLRLGFLANFLSHPVISGFISASAIVIAASQLKTLLGIQAEGETLPRCWRSLPATCTRSNWLTLAIGAAATALPVLGAQGAEAPADLPGAGAARWRTC